MLERLRRGAELPRGGIEIGKNRTTIAKIQRMLAKAERPLSFSEIEEGLRGYHQPTSNQLAALLGRFKGFFARIATVPVASALSGSHREGLYCLRGDEERYLGNLPFDALVIEDGDDNQ